MQQLAAKENWGNALRSLNGNLYIYILFQRLSVKCWQEYKQAWPNTKEAMLPSRGKVSQLMCDLWRDWRRKSSASLLLPKDITTIISQVKLMAFVNCQTGWTGSKQRNHWLCTPPLLSFKTYDLIRMLSTQVETGFKNNENWVESQYNSSIPV